LGGGGERDHRGDRAGDSAAVRLRRSWFSSTSWGEPIKARRPSLSKTCSCQCCAAPKLRIGRGRKRLPADLEQAPQADLNQLLDSLRTTEVELYGIEVVQQVQQLSDAEKQEFVAARLHLTAVVNQLNTAQLSDIADKLEQHSGEFGRGFRACRASLNSLTGVAKSGASAVNGIIGAIGQVIPLL
jgi:hypothetical protein